MSAKKQEPTKKKKAQKSNYDSAWKNVIRKLFKDFLEFFFPDIYQAIDFTKRIHFLDKELSEIHPGSNIGDRVADILVKIHLKNGNTKYICIFIHLEVQSQPRQDFMERMYIYNYRAYDKNIEDRSAVISAAILADDDENYRPDEYCVSEFGFELRMKIPIVKIIDYQLKKELREKLESSVNPMSLVVKAQLKSHEVKKADNESRFEVTKELIRLCYKHGYSRNNTRLIMNFFAWVIRLPLSYKERIKEVIKKAEEEFKMEYVPIWERDAVRQGKREGKREGMKEGIKKTAEKMVKKGFDLDTIVEITGLDKKEIEKLLSKPQ